MAYVNYDDKFQQDELHATRKYALGLPSGPTNYQNTIPLAPHAVWGGVAGNLVQGPRYQRRISGLLGYDWRANYPSGGVERVRLYKLTNQHTPGVGGQRFFAGPQISQSE